MNMLKYKPLNDTKPGINSKYKLNIYNKAYVGSYPTKNHKIRQGVPGQKIFDPRWVPTFLTTFFLPTHLQNHTWLFFPNFFLKIQL